MNRGEPVPVKPDWESGRREQLRRWAAMPLRDQLLALEEMAELAERISNAPAVAAPVRGHADPRDERGPGSS